MNARQYRTEYILSALDFPAITGPGESTVDYRTESPVIIDNKVRLEITMKYILVEFYKKKRYEVLSAKSVYEIPVNHIRGKERETVYDCYRDAIAGLNEAYAFGKRSLPQLPEIVFPSPPIEQYQREIERVLLLINSLN